METVTLQKLISLVLLVLFTVFHSSLTVAADTEADALLNWVNPWPRLPSDVTSPCTWVGISCNLAASVIRINLTNLGVKGTLQNFSFSSFPNLVEVDLHMNKLSGPIPSQISQLSELTYLDLSYNQFSGIIPPELGNLFNLVKLYMRYNNLSGPIPSTIGNLTELTRLFMNQNQLSGPIPQEVRYLKSIEGLSLSRNTLCGPIPEFLGALENLTELYLYENQFSGSIPEELGQLKYLDRLYLRNNQITGPIPASVGNLSNLEHLDLSHNNLSGSIPEKIGNLAKLSGLYLYNNQFIGYLPRTICQSLQLQYFAVHDNRLEGPIPKSLRDCKSFLKASFGGNRFTGNISEAFGVYPNLKYMDLSHNQFYGEVSSNWGSCSSLATLKIAGNNISGRIPPEIGDAAQLQTLDLSSNQLVGEIPKELAKLHLQELTLNCNQLSDGLPPEFSSMSTLEHLDLSTNRINQTIPKFFGNFTKLIYLNLSNNMFFNKIPIQLEKLAELSMLDLSWNNLSGEIPSQISSLQSLEMLNLSHNGLSGSIPDSFAEMSGLLSIDLSYNQLEGPIPNSKAFRNASIEKLQGNKGLCGDVRGLQSCKGSLKKRHVSLFLITFLPLLGASLLLSFFVVLYFSYKRKRDPGAEPNAMSDEEPSSTSNFCDTTGATSHDNYRSRKELDESRTSQYLPFFDISIILAATENFSNKLGQGGFGSVYKGQLAGGQEIAVKRLSKNSGQGMQEFKNEVRLISKLQHRNLVKLIGYCIHEEEKMLIYEYLPNKSLDLFIFDETGRLLLDWGKRSEIIFGIARGVLYLHQDSRLKIIHRDLKASNILLDAAMNPKISDFGLAKLFEEEQVEANTRRVIGTYGYMSPEYAMDGMYSIKSDVFSFGVLTLEIICGKKNADYHEKMPALNLIGHVWNLWSEAKAMDIVDPLLKQPYPQEILRCIQIGLLCVQESPADRPTMLIVLFMLGNEMSIPSPKKPVFLLQEHCGRNLDLLAARGEVSSVNYVTVSDIEAR